MNKGDRKLVHEFANAFSVRSKSMGSGNSRFTVLTRTLRTDSSYSDAAMDSIEARFFRRFAIRGSLKKAERSNKHDWGVDQNRNNGVFGAASYRNGEVVGASAPELGLENKGRTILEKMGWKAGSGLGAINNQGILQPVAHVVKTNKAGLG